MGNKRGRITFLASLIATSALCVGVAAAAAPSVDVGNATPDASNKAVVTVSLTSNGANVGGLQNAIVFDNTILTLTPGNCPINPAIGLSPGGLDCTSDTTVGPCKNLSKVIHQCGTSPQPVGCPAGAGSNLSAFTGIVAATAAPNTNSIPDGALYTCTFTVSGTLPAGGATLQNIDIVTSSPSGLQLCSSSGATPCGGTNGLISSGIVPPTNTPGTPGGPTNTPGTPGGPTNTPGTPGGPTNTPGTPGGPTKTATATATAMKTPGGPTNTPVPSGLDSDGCQISTVGGSASWLLLIPAVGLLVVRRRHR
ncbi:MAG TPA: hypothetical protein VF515_02855 [Candidatus Binatia bacterium]